MKREAFSRTYIRNPVTPPLPSAVIPLGGGRSIRVNSRLKLKIASIISSHFKVPQLPLQAFQVTGRSGSLYQVNSGSQRSAKQYPFLRGCCIDVEEYKVVGKSLGYNIELECDKIAVSGEYLLVTDIRLPLRSTRLEVGLEDTLIMVFLWKDIFYVATHRNLFASKVKISENQTLLDRYIELGGPSRNSLFGSLSSSPHCHYFLLHAPEVLRASRFEFPENSHGLLVYLGWSQMWESDNIQPNIPATEANFGVALRERKLYTRSKLNTDTANSYLRLGSYKLEGRIPESYPKQLLPGEFVMLMQYGESGQLKHIWKLVSPGYSWRAEVTGRDRDPKHRFSILSKLVYSDPELLRRKIGFLEGISTEYIFSAARKGRILVAPPRRVKPPISQDAQSLLQTICCALLFAYPPHLQGEILPLLSTLSS